MAQSFIAEEIFIMAEQIERNGLNFYTHAAEMQDDPELKGILTELAEEESKHLHIFQTMREKLADKAKLIQVDDPYDMGGDYLRALADTHIFSKKVDVSDLLPVNSSFENVIELASRFEKDSVLFFRTLADFVGEEQGKSRIEKLAQEEEFHLVHLQRLLKNHRG